MSTNIQIDVLLQRLKQVSDQTTQQNRAERQEREEALLQASSEPLPTPGAVKDKLAAARGEVRERADRVARFKDGEERSAVPDLYRKKRPAAQRGGTDYWILARKCWWLSTRTFGEDPRASATSINDVTLQVKLQIVGDGSSTFYITGAEGGDSATDLLNGLDPNVNTFYGLPYIPAGTAAPTVPFIDQMTGPRLAIPDNRPGRDNYYEENYTALSIYQLVIRSGNLVSFYKPFFNVALETLEPTQIFSATQPRKLVATSTTPSTGTAKYQARTFEGADTVLFDVNHVYLCGKVEFAQNTIKPLGSTNTVDVFITFGIDRSGGYQVSSSLGSSRFSVGSVVYWLYGALSRLATVSSVQTGTFVYTITPATETSSAVTATFTGVRVRLTLSENLSELAYASYFNTQIIATFESVNDALASTDSVWIDRLDQLGGFANEWVVQRIQGGTIPLPSTSANCIGYSDILADYMDCSKAGKGYFVQASLLQRDQPAWNNQENYHDGDIVAQRPRSGPGDNSAFIVNYIRVVFFELDCQTNTITRSTSNIGAVPNFWQESFYPLMPDWFPSKRYRLAGWNGALNLNKQETQASRIRSQYDPATGGYRRFLRTWTLNTESMQTRVASLQSEQGYTEIDVTSSYPEEPDFIQIGDEQGPSRWGYTFSEDNYISA